MFLKKKLGISLFIAVLMLIVFQVSAQNRNATDTVLNNNIVSAVLSSDANNLAKHFHNQIDLVLMDDSGIYSKLQATFILKDFFKTNKAESFHIINEDTNKGSNFIVGKLHTADRQYRVCFLTKESDKKTLIYQVRIEE